MAIKVVKHGSVWLTIDTRTHAIKGRHASRAQANEQRRVLETLGKRRGKR